MPSFCGTVYPSGNAVARRFTWIGYRVAVNEEEVTVMESYTPMTSDRVCAAPAVAFGIAAKQRGTGLSASARGTNVRAHITDDVVPGLYVWSPSA